MTCIRWSCCLLPFLGKIPFQQGIFPKRSYSWKPKIDSFPPTTKPRPLNILNVDPPFLYWLGTSGWYSGPCVLIPVSFAFFFFHSHIVSTILAMSRSTMSLLFMLIFHDTKGISLHYFFLFPYGLAHWLGISSYPTNSMGLRGRNSNQQAHGHSKKRKEATRLIYQIRKGRRLSPIMLINQRPMSNTH